MKKVLKVKTARRWLARNAMNIAKFNTGTGADKRSCFHRQLLLCERTIRLAS